MWGCRGWRMDVFCYRTIQFLASDCGATKARSSREMCVQYSACDAAAEYCRTAAAALLLALASPCRPANASQRY